MFQPDRNFGIDLKRGTLARQQQHLAFRRALQLLRRPVRLRKGAQLVVVERIRQRFDLAHDHILAEEPAAHEARHRLAQLPARVAVLIALSALGALLIAAILEMQAGATAYIVGEGHWSKAQQRAVHSLYRYAGHGDPADLADAREALRVPLGDRAARQALERDEHAAWFD